MASDNNAATVSTAPRGQLSPIFQSEGQEAQSPLDVLQVTRPESDRAGLRSAAITTGQEGSSQLPGADPHDCETDSTAAAGHPHVLLDSLQRNTCSVGPCTVWADAEHSSQAPVAHRGNGLCVS